MSVAPSAAVYTDFSGLAALRGRAQSDEQKALGEVAKQFEAIFMQMMLKSMRAASLGEGIFDNDQSEQYRDLLDSQLSISLSQGRGMGLADAIVRQLGGEAGVRPTSEVRGPLLPAPVSPHTRLTPGADQEVTAAPEPQSQATLPARFDSPEGFIEALFPYAAKAARLLGLGPEVLIAQSALETGWGKAVIADARGASSHNLFNIKADSRWDGPVVAKNTLEYVDGVAVRERALFRRYDSPEQSFQDYVAFLQGSARYASALTEAGDAKGFVRALQNAGYATDPAYANKISAILDRFKSGELPPIPSS
ncbi:MAG: flagellar assembly peptidoglycan hydrolase FlgJ [Proteobacteria bacterium]|nr:MAG: flagellar assembly peptidoglycan hydrolase FlgJ [Pseudomonadota bacterium]